MGSNPNNLGMQTHYDYFAPRIGFAYRVSEDTVVRGGFGISYTPFEDNTYAYNYPVRANNGYTAANLYTPATLNIATVGCSATQTYFSFACGFPAPVPVTIPSNGIITASGSLLAQSEFYIPLTYHNPLCEFVEHRGRSRPCPCSSTCS